MVAMRTSYKVYFTAHGADGVSVNTTGENLWVVDVQFRPVAVLEYPGMYM